MSNYSFAKNHSTANRCGGSFAAHTSAVLLIAGIAMAMSVIFFLGNVVAVRLCIILGLVALIALVVNATPAQLRVR